MQIYDFVVLTGPTGTGKTSLFEEVLKPALGAEAINIDTGQFIGELKIGTARPEPGQGEHFFGAITAQERFTFVQFNSIAQELVLDIKKRGGLPVFVGGSMFYIKSLFWPIRQTETLGLVNKIPEDIKSGTKEARFKFLRSIDPKRAQEINPADLYRVNRALSIWETGQLPSSVKPAFIAKKCIIFYVDMPKDAHKKQISIRTDQMLAAGWIEEVLALPEEHRNVLKHKLIGYDVVVDFIEGRIDSNTLREKIIEQTLAYASRQRKFFRRFSSMLNQADVDGRVKIIKLEHDGLGGLSSAFWTSVKEEANQ